MARIKEENTTTPEVTDTSNFEELKKQYEVQLAALQAENEKLLNQNDEVQKQLEKKEKSEKLGRPIVEIEGKSYIFYGYKEFKDSSGKTRSIENEADKQAILELIKKGTQLFVEIKN